MKSETDYRISPSIRSGRKNASFYPRHKMSLRRSTARILSLRLVSGKLLLLLAIALMGMAVAQKPSMLLLCITPKGMAATTLRLFMGLLIAVCVRSSVLSMLRGPYALRRRRWKSHIAFALMFILLAFAYEVLGSQAFTTLRLSDLVAHKAYVMQSVAFAVLWLVFLK